MAPDPGPGELQGITRAMNGFVVQVPVYQQFGNRTIGHVARSLCYLQWRTRQPQRKHSASSPNAKTSIIKYVAIAPIQILSGLLSGIITLILQKYPLIIRCIVLLSSYVCNVLAYIAALVCTSGQLISTVRRVFHLIFYLALFDQSQWIPGKMTRLNVCR